MNRRVEVQVVIQARMGSTRLPGKVLLPLGGRPVLGHVVRRSSAARKVDRTVVATTTRAEDDAIEGFCKSSGIPVFRGDSEDVLDRYRSAIGVWPTDAVIRITADCPLIDPAVIDDLISFFGKGSWDYAANVNPPTFPAGFDAEILSSQSLERAWREASLKSHREHVTLFIREHPESFRIGNLTAKTDRSALRCTLDRPEDYTFLEALFAHIPEGDPAVGLEDILRIIDSNPELAKLNAGIDRYEGVKKSTQAENRPLDLILPQTTKIP